MKKLTEDILNILNSDNFSDLYSFEEAVKINGFENEIHQDVSFEEAYYDLINIRDILIESINKNNLFESLSTYSTRNFTLSTLTSIDTHITNIKNKSNHVPPFIQAVESLKDKLNAHLISLSIKGLPLYYKKLQDVNYLKSKYSKLISELKRADKFRDDIKDFLIEIKEMHGEAKSAVESAEESGTNINSIKKDIEEKYGQIKISDKNIADYEVQSKQNKEEINAFFAEIDNYTEKLKTSLNNSETNLAQFRKDISLSLDENKYNTELIINTNETIQKNIFDLLGKAVGTNLYKSFKEKVKWMRWQSLGWLLLLIGSIVFISIAGKDVIKILSELLKNGQNNNIGLSFYLKSTLIFPAIYAIYFSAAQYKNTTKLLEEYEFKSAVSVVLHYFKDQVEKAKDSDNTQDFLIRSIEKIFESPTDKVFGKKLSVRKKDLLSEIADMVKNKANDILPTE